MMWVVFDAIFCFARPLIPLAKPGTFLTRVDYTFSQLPRKSFLVR